MPSGPPRYRPMLAHSGFDRLAGGDWAVEPKLDGYRVLLTVAGGTISVRTRGGNEQESRLAGLAPLAETERAFVIDGELDAPTADGGVDFARLGGRMQLGAARIRWAHTPCELVAFDLLWLDGEDLCPRPCAERRELLEGLDFDGPCWSTIRR